MCGRGLNINPLPTAGNPPLVRSCTSSPSDPGPCEPEGELSSACGGGGASLAPRLIGDGGGTDWTPRPAGGGGGAGARRLRAGRSADWWGCPVASSETDSAASRDASRPPGSHEDADSRLPSNDRLKITAYVDRDRDLSTIPRRIRKYRTITW